MHAEQAAVEEKTSSVITQLRNDVAKLKAGHYYWVLTFFKRGCKSSLRSRPRGQETRPWPRQLMASLTSLVLNRLSVQLLRNGTYQ